MSDAGVRPPVLKREIGLFGATALGIGAIIGSGIFIVTGIVAGIAGPAMIFSVLIAGVITVFSAMSVAELGAYLPEEGGTYAYAQKLISPFAGFIAGWVWIFSNIFVGAAVSLGFAHYFVTLFPSIPVKIIAVAICLVFIFINYIGLKESIIFNNILVMLKVLILLFFVAFGLGFFRPGNFTPFAPEGSMGILSGAALIFFAYTGFARVTIMAEEVKDPEKTIPRSIYLALGISTVIYLLVSIIAVGLAGAPALAQSSSPLADAIGSTGSTRALLMISLGAMIATASVLLTTVMGISRIIFSMARSQDLPLLFGRIHPRFGTPHYAIAITGTCMIAALLPADLALVIAVSTFLPCWYST
jgi:APA family basic amino acid/polyamine antiporter